MNFMANKKLFFTKNTTKKKLKQSKLDGFLKSPPTSRTVKANRSAMLQEFFMGAVTCPARPPKGSTKGSAAAAANGPGETSISSADHTGPLESRVVMAITEGRSNARGEVGIAAIDVHCPELILCQLSDDMWYSGTIIKIQMLSPVEVLLPNTFFNAKLSQSKLLTILRSTFPTVAFKETPRKHFHDSEALDRIERISATNIDDVKIALENKYYALAACNALLSYVGIAYFLTFAEKSLRVLYESRYAAMTIDMETSKRLELVATLSPTTGKRTCLFSLMDHCMTRIGRRSLRARILEPFADVQMIRQCHEAIRELVAKDNYQCTLRMILRRFHQVDRLMKLSLVPALDGDSTKASEAMISLTLMLKSCLATIPMLLDLLSALESPVFVGIRAGLEDSRYRLVLEHIERILNTGEAQPQGHQSVHAQRINAVKPNVDQVLDLSRSFYGRVVDEVTALARQLSAQHDMSLQLVHNASKGYQLAVTASRTTTLSYPEELLVVSRRGNKVILTTDALGDLNARLKRIVDDIMVTSNQVIGDMLRSIRQEIDVVYLLTGIITELDLIQCFAHLSRSAEFTCPGFGQGETRIVDAVHPFLEYGRLRTLPVPNQVMATADHNLFLITGPNMGGKTVYIKMIAVLQVMAQVGCFVPAASAQFRICDKLFSRIGFEDSIDKGVSSFGMEVEQMSFILNNVTPNSLVIIDELGRGTNPGEGQQWAWQMCQQLAVLKGCQSNGHFYVDDEDYSSAQDSTLGTRRPLRAITSPFVYVTTHFLELTKLSDQFFNVVNLHLVAEENRTEGENVRLTYTHRVQVGVTPLTEYGLALARTVKFPSKVMPKAEQVLQKIKDLRVGELINSSTSSAATSATECALGWSKEKSLYDLYASIASICRRMATQDFFQDVDDELKGLLRDFSMKCSQELRDSIRKQSLEETFNQSRLFARGEVEGDETSFRGTQLRGNGGSCAWVGNGQDGEESGVIPETPQTDLSQQSSVTNATHTSWMTAGDQEGEKTILSQASYHSLLRRLAERKMFGPMSKKSPFNEHKGFPVLPFVKLLEVNEKEVSGGAKEVERVAKGTDYGQFSKNVKTATRSDSPDLFEEADDQDPRSDSPIEGSLRLNRVQAGGDNLLLVESQCERMKVPRREHNLSFFNDTEPLSNPDDMWDFLQTQIKNEKDEKSFQFDSPEQRSSTQRFFASQFESGEDFFTSQFVQKNGRDIPCTVTRPKAESNGHDFRFDTTAEIEQATRKGLPFVKDSPNTIEREENILRMCSNSNSHLIKSNASVDWSFSNSKDQVLWTQASQEKGAYYDTQPCSNTSNMNFRLGLLDLEQPSSSAMPSHLNWQSNDCAASLASQSSGRAEQNPFIAKYGKVIQEKYRKSQSQANQLAISKNRNSQSGAQEFLAKYGAKLMEKKLFKEPPVKFPTPFLHQRTRPLEMNASMSSISSIHSTEPVVASKQDYSAWLGQYCRSRVESLGVPMARKRSHNSSLRSARAKMDIESVNRRWESYYSEYNQNRNSGSPTSSCPERRVSFGGEGAAECDELEDFHY